MRFDVEQYRFSASYRANPGRYATAQHRPCGSSGLKLSALGLGMWQHFGAENDFQAVRRLVCRAFEIGITHFDLANNYGRPPGTAEESLGRLLRSDLKGVRDELVITTKAGYDMWPGPYGTGGSRKYLVASCHASLRRLGVDYVDVFYSHRFDPETPLDETMEALASLVRMGKALYVGISSYSPQQTAEAVGILQALGTPCLVHQASYSLFNRWVEPELLPTLEAAGVGCVAFSVLAQGLLSDSYVGDVLPDVRARRPGNVLRLDAIPPEALHRVRMLADIAHARGQSLSQMAIAWALRSPVVSSALVGVRTIDQLEENAAAMAAAPFDASELARIDALAVDSGLDLWQPSQAVVRRRRPGIGAVGRDAGEGGAEGRREESATRNRPSREMGGSGTEPGACVP